MGLVESFRYNGSSFPLTGYDFSAIPLVANISETCMTNDLLKELKTFYVTPKSLGTATCEYAVNDAVLSWTDEPLRYLPLLSTRSDLFTVLLRNQVFPFKNIATIAELHVANHSLKRYSAFR